MRPYAPRVELLSTDGSTLIRRIPGDLAAELVAGEVAVIANVNGRVKAVRLIASAESHATRIGPPSPPSLAGTKFTRLSRLGSGLRVIEHHPRCLYVME
jgi:hypothetical protein